MNPRKSIQLSDGVFYSYPAARALLDLAAQDNRQWWPSFWQKRDMRELESVGAIEYHGKWQGYILTPIGLIHAHELDLALNDSGESA